MSLLLTVLLLATQDHKPEFEVSGAVKYKSFLTRDQRATILNDYRDYNDYALMELGVDLNFQIPLPFELETLTVRAHPYFWIAQENNLCHIGLETEIEYPIFDSLDFGYRHYSWHNADDDSPDNRGRTQDSFYLLWNFADWRFGEDGPLLSFFLRPQVYAYNTDPMAIQDFYTSNDPGARYELRAGARLDCQKFHAEVWPYARADSDFDVWVGGVAGQVSYDLFKNVSLFADINEIFGQGIRLDIIAIGMAIRFN